MRITLPSGTPAELVTPDEPARRGLVVLPDIMGLRPLFDDLCARLSREQGWAVCAPEPFPGNESLDVDGRFELLRSVYDDDKRRDALEAADATGCDIVGLIGFCMGGMYALVAAGLGRFHRVVSFYGMITVPTAWAGPGHGPPVEEVDKAGSSPVLAVIGGVDPWTPPDDVERLERAGAAVVRYPEAEHGFVHDPERPSHRPDDAADAWARAIAFLSE